MSNRKIMMDLMLTVVDRQHLQEVIHCEAYHPSTVHRH